MLYKCNVPKQSTVHWYHIKDMIVESTGVTQAQGREIQVVVLDPRAVGRVGDIFWALDYELTQARMCPMEAVNDI